MSSTISFSGLSASGLDTSSWVDALVSVKSQSVTSLEAQKTEKENLLNIVNNIKTYFSSFQSCLQKITDSQYGIASMDLFLQNLAISSNTNIATATATTEAARQSYDVAVDSLATATKATSGYSQYEVKKATLDTTFGTLGGKNGTVTVNSQSFRVTTDDTLGSLVTKFKNVGVDANFDEDKGIFTIGCDLDKIDEGATNLKSALKLQNNDVSGAVSGSLVYANRDTKFSKLGLTAGKIKIEGTDYTIAKSGDNYTIQKSGGTAVSMNTLGDFLDYLESAAVGADEATVDDKGNISIKGAILEKVSGGTNLMDVLNLVEAQERTVSESGALSYIEVRTADLNTTLSALGITGDTTLVAGGVSNTIKNDKTLGDIQTILRNAGVDMTVDNNGVITIDTKGNEISGTLLDVLNLDPTKGGTTVSSSVHMASLDAEGTTKLSALGVTNSHKYTAYNSDGTAVTGELTNLSNKTINELVTDLKNAGLDASFDNKTHKLVINDGYITGTLADVLGMSETTTTYTENATTSTTLEKLGATGNSTLTINGGASKTYGKDTTLQTIFDDIEAEGGKVTFKDGNLTIEGATLGGTLPALLGLDATTQGTSVTSGALTAVTGSSSTGSNNDATIEHDIDLTTKIGDITGTTSSYTLKVGDGTSTTYTKDTTLQTLKTQIEGAGGTFTINDDNTISIDGVTMSGTLVGALGFDEVATGTKFTTVDPIMIQGTSTAATGGSSIGELGLVGGTASYSMRAAATLTLTIDGGSVIRYDSTATLDDIFDDIEAAGGTATVDEDGYIVIDGVHLEGTLVDSLGLVETGWRTTITSGNLQVTTSTKSTSSGTLYTDEQGNITINSTIGSITGDTNSYSMIINGTSYTFGTNSKLSDVRNAISAEGGTMTVNSDNTISINGVEVAGGLYDKFGFTNNGVHTVISSNDPVYYTSGKKAADTGTTFEQVGVASDKRDYAIYANDGTLIQSSSTTGSESGKTVGDWLSAINSALNTANGTSGQNYATINNGVISITGGYVTGALPTELGIGTEQVQTGVTMTGSSVTYTEYGTMDYISNIQTGSGYAMGSAVSNGLIAVAVEYLDEEGNKYAVTGDVKLSEILDADGNKLGSGSYTFNVGSYTKTFDTDTTTLNDVVNYINNLNLDTTYETETSALISDGTIAIESSVGISGTLLDALGFVKTEVSSVAYEVKGTEKAHYGSSSTTATASTTVAQLMSKDASQTLTLTATDGTVKELTFAATDTVQTIINSLLAENMDEVDLVDGIFRIRDNVQWTVSGELANKLFGGDDTLYSITGDESDYTITTEDDRVFSITGEKVSYTVTTEGDKVYSITGEKGSYTVTTGGGGYSITGDEISYTTGTGGLGSVTGNQLTYTETVSSTTKIYTGTTVTYGATSATGYAKSTKISTFNSFAVGKRVYVKSSDYTGSTTGYPAQSLDFKYLDITSTTTIADLVTFFNGAGGVRSATYDQLTGELSVECKTGYTAICSDFLEKAVLFGETAENSSYTWLIGTTGGSSGSTATTSTTFSDLLLAGSTPTVTNNGTTYTFEYTTGSTVADAVTWLNSLDGVSASFSSGKLTVTGAEDLAFNLDRVWSTLFGGSIPTAITSTTLGSSSTVAATLDTTLGQLGINDPAISAMTSSGGYLSHPDSLTSTTTLRELFEYFSTYYGVTGSISDGKVTLSAGEERILAGNVIEKLFGTTSVTITPTSGGSTVNATASTTVAQLLGTSDSQTLILTTPEGTSTTLTFQSTDTVQTIMDTLMANGFTGGSLTDGKLTLISNTQYTISGTLAGVLLGGVAGSTGTTGATGSTGAVDGGSSSGTITVNVPVFESSSILNADSFDPTITTYFIYSADELNKIAELVNSGEDSTNIRFELKRDIDMSGVTGFVPIGFGGEAFKGTFDGQGHTIKNLTVNVNGVDSYGLFGDTAGAIINNLELENVNIVGDGYVGALIGCAHNTTVTNCYVSGIVKGKVDSYIGGLIGNEGGGSTITNCYSTANVDSKTLGSNAVVGTLVGAIGQGTNVTNCFTTGTIYANDGDRVGTIVGVKATGSYITSCYYDSTNTSGSSTIDNYYGTGKTLSALKNQTFLESIGFSVNDWSYTTTSSFPKLMGTAYVKLSSADYTNGGTYIIQDSADIVKLAEICSSGAGTSDSEFYMTNDIDMSGVTGFTGINGFEGYFYGNAYSINNLTIISSSSNVGLFNTISADTSIQSVDLKNVNITSTAANACVGALVGSMEQDSWITDCSVTGTVTATGSGSKVGGLVGATDGDIEYCWSGATVNGASNSQAGGLVGCAFSSSYVRYCYATGNVTGGEAGGLVGGASSEIEYSWASGNVTGKNSANKVGGLVGVGADVSNCFALGTVSGEGDLYAVGYINGTPTDVYYDVAKSVNTGDYGQGKSLSELTSQSFLESIGFDSTSGWTYGSVTMSGSGSSDEGSGSSGLGSGSGSGTGSTGGDYSYTLEQVSGGAGSSTTYDITASTTVAQLFGSSDSQTMTITAPDGTSTTLTFQSTDTVQTIMDTLMANGFTGVSLTDGKLTLISNTQYTISGTLAGVLLGGVAGSTGTTGSSGLQKVSEMSSFVSGTTYLVSTADDLNKLAELVNNGADTSGVNFVLTNDISMVGGGFTPIGTETNAFKGTFDGQGFKISGLSIAGDYGWEGVGLFGCTSNATIKNLGLESVDIDVSTFSAGALVGSAANTTITSCWASGTIANSFTEDLSVNGGLVGALSTNSTLTDSYSKVNITSDSSKGCAGGLVGVVEVNSTIDRCYATGTTSGEVAGCLIGADWDGLNTISNSYANGSVLAQGTAGVETGALTGILTTLVASTYTNCYYGSNVATSNNNGIGTSKTLAQLSSQSFKEGLGFTSANGWSYGEFIVDPVLTYTGTVIGTTSSGSGSSTGSTGGDYSYTLEQVSGGAGSSTTYDITASTTVAQLFGSSDSQTMTITAPDGTSTTLTFQSTDTVQTIMDTLMANGFTGVSLTDGKLTLIADSQYTVSGAIAEKLLGENSVTLAQISGSEGSSTTYTTTASTTVAQLFGTSDSQTLILTTPEGTSTTLTFQSTDTVQTIMDTLMANGFTGVSLTDGKLTLTSNEQLNVSGALADKLLANIGGTTSSSGSLTTGGSSGVSGIQNVSEVSSFISGTTYAVSTVADLNKLAELVNGGADTTDVTFVMTNDIDMSGVSFTSIGSGDEYFQGTFDGQGYVIKNLTIDSEDSACVGLFGYAKDATIKNLGIVDADVKNNNTEVFLRHTGILVGKFSGTITNCYATGNVTGTVSGPGIVGGLVGSAFGTITNCYATATVSGPGNVGGLVGRTFGTITNCYATGAVTGTNQVSDFGGLVGSAFGTITNCYATGAVSGPGNVGGLVGRTDESTTIERSYATGAVSGPGTVGGLVGSADGTITNCYATGAVTGTNQVSDLGGLVGSADGTITNCYATGAVSGPGTVGGLVGSADGTITNCYATGAVTSTGEASIIGGLVGYTLGATIECSYATGNVTGTVSGPGIVGGLVGCTNESTTIKWGYAAGTVSGTGIVGGLVGNACGGTITISYYNRSTSSVEAFGELYEEVSTSYIFSYCPTLNQSTLEGIGFTSDNGWYYPSATSNPILDRLYTLEQVSGSTEDYDMGQVSATKNLYTSRELSYMSGPQRVSEVTELIAGNKYHIATADDLVALANFVNNGADTTGSTFYFDADIDMSGVSDYVPIGTLDNAFKGTVCGNGHVVKNLTIDSEGSDYTGLFGFIDGATIQDLGVVDANITARTIVGILAGRASNSTIKNVYTTGSIDGHSVVGGLVGFTQNCTVTDSYSTANVTGSDDSVGGLIGECYNTYLDRTYTTGNVYSDDYMVGGLVGEALSGTTIKNSYATGDISGHGDVGGIAGAIEDLGACLTIDTVYSTGRIYSDLDDNGGIAGSVYGWTDGSLITNAVYNKNGCSVGLGYDYEGTVSTSGITGKSYSQMLQQSTMESLGFTADKGWVYTDNYTPTLGNVTVTGGGKVYVDNSITSFQTGATYYISDVSHLKNLASLINGGADTTGVTFVLENDIDASSLSQSIGTNNAFAFKGSFYGNGHSITGLTVSLFGYVKDDAYIRDLALENMSGGRLADTVVGNSYIDNVYSTGTTKATTNAGGLIGLLGGSAVLSNSYSTANVTSTTLSGGLVGTMTDNAVIEHSFYSGSVVRTTSNGYAGGLVGTATGGTINSCYVTGNVNGGLVSGGLIGQVESGATVAISNSYAAGYMAVATGSRKSGMLVGRNNGTVNSTGNVYKNNIITAAVGDGNSITGATGLSEADMQCQATMEAHGFTADKGWVYYANETPKLQNKDTSQVYSVNADLNTRLDAICLNGEGKEISVTVNGVTTTQYFENSDTVQEVINWLNSIDTVTASFDTTSSTFSISSTASDFNLEGDVANLLFGTDKTVTESEITVNTDSNILQQDGDLTKITKTTTVGELLGKTSGQYAIAYKDESGNIITQNFSVDDTLQDVLDYLATQGFTADIVNGVFTATRNGQSETDILGIIGNKLKGDNATVESTSTGCRSNMLTSASSVKADSDTKLSELGINTGSIIIRDSANNNLGTIQVNSAMTINDLAQLLDNYGFTLSITDGKVTVEGEGANRLSDGTSNLVSQLMLDNWTETKDKLQATSTVAQMGFGKGSVLNLIIDDKSYNLAFGADNTLQDIIDTLATYGVTASVDTNGKFTASADGNLVLANELGAYLTKNSVEGYVKEANAYKSQDPLEMEGEWVELDYDSKVGDILGTGKGGILRLTLNNNEVVELQYNADDTMTDIIADLRGYGITATIDEGVLNAISMNKTFKFSGDIGKIISGDNPLYEDISTGYVSKDLSYETTEKANWNNTLKEMGISSGQFHVMSNAGKILVTLDVDEDYTMAQVKSMLQSYDINLTMDANGKVTATSAEGYKLADGSSNIVSKLGLTNWTTDSEKLSGTTTISEMGFKDGADLNLFLDGAVMNVLSFDADQTLDDVIFALSAYGIDASVNADGQFTAVSKTHTFVMSSGLGSYLTKGTGGYVNSDTAYQAYKALEEDFDYVVNTSDKLKYETEMTENSTLASLGFAQGGSVRVTLDGSTTYALEFLATDKVQDIIFALSAYGIDAKVEDGKFVAESVNNTFTMSGNVGSYLVKGGTYNNEVTGYESRPLTYQTTETLTNDTKLSDLGITHGDINVIKDGVVSATINITDDTTIGQLFSAIKPYGMTGSIVTDGAGNTKIKIYADTDITLADGTSNVVSALGLQEIRQGDFEGNKIYWDDDATSGLITTDTLLSSLDRNGFIAQGSLIFTTGTGDDAVEHIINITADETVGSLLKKFTDSGIKASLDNGVIKLTGGLDVLNFVGGTSGLVETIGLDIENIDKYAASSSALTYEGETHYSAANFANANTKLEIVNASDGVMSIFVDGIKCSIQVNSSETFEDLFQRIKDEVRTRTGLEIEAGFKTKDGGISSDPTEANNTGIIALSIAQGHELVVGASNDTTNFATIANLNKTDWNAVTGSRALYRVNVNSLITQSGLYRDGDITEGTFKIGDATFTIDSTTTLASLIKEINQNDKAYANAYWDTLSGTLVIQSTVTGASLINIEAGSSNFTDILGFTREKDGVSALVTDSQTLGQNAVVRINGTTVTSATNVITSDISKIKGLTINLKNVSEGETVTITVEQDKEGIYSAVEDTIDAYNAMMEALNKELSDRSSLGGESILKLMRNNLKRLMTSSLTGAHVFKNLSSIGISTGEASDNITTNITSLFIDKEKFMDALTADSDSVQNLLVGTTTNPGIFLQANDIVESSIRVDGYFSNMANTLTKSISNIEKKITKTNTAIENYRTKLQNKFHNMELTIAGLQSAYANLLN